MNESVGNRPRRWLTAAFGALVATMSLPAAAWAQTGSNLIESSDGVSAVWIFANISYAGMRAQNHPSDLWRIVSFLFGFPGTLASWFLIDEGEGSMYGLQLPTVDWSEQD